MGREKNLSVNDPGTNNWMKSCSFGHHFILFKNKQDCVDLGFFLGGGMGVDALGIRFAPI